MNRNTPEHQLVCFLWMMSGDHRRQLGSHWFSDICHNSDLHDEMCVRLCVCGGGRDMVLYLLQDSFCVPLASQHSRSTL